MDFLKAEIAKKKRMMEEKKVFAEPGKKYFKRGDLAKKESEEYLARHSGGADEAVDPKNEQFITKKVSTLVSGPSKSEEELKKEEREKAIAEMPVLPRSEVVKRLRDRGEPIILFDETETESCLRLRRVEIEDAVKIEGVEGQSINNDFKAAMDTVDKVYLDLILKGEQDEEEAGDSSKSKKPKSKFDVVYTETDMKYEDLLEAADKVNKGDVSKDHKLVSDFIKVMLKMWGEELNSRDEDTKVSVRGKIEAGVFTQTKTYLKPLQKMLKKETVTDDIRDSLLKMIKFALMRDYILCNEAYMEMAIGNAPWPIGVTNAGIHARPARENIFSKHVAHVLNDETQRKYIQGLKRLMTNAQRYYPTDPSRSIDFVKSD